MARKTDKKPLYNKGEIHPERIFNTPNELLEAFEGYKLDVNKQSLEWIKVQYVGKEGERKEDGLKVPLTYEGFKRYCRNNYGEVSQYFNNNLGYYDDFVSVCTHIKEEIRENQIIGGLLGVYNPSITQRLNNLAEVQETHVKHEGHILSIDPLTNDGK